MGEGGGLKLFQGVIIVCFFVCVGPSITAAVILEVSHSLWNIGFKP